MEISVVLPCFNEEKIIGKTIQSIFEWFDDFSIDGEVIVVNDGSQDGTKKVLEREVTTYKRLIVVTNQINQGYGSAIRRGCDEASGDNICFMDSDGQIDIKDLSKLLPLLKEYHFVSGIRENRADPIFRLINSELYQCFVKITLGIRAKDFECGLKVFKKSVWKLIRPKYATGAFFDAELYFNLKKNQIAFAEVNINHFPRKRGRPTGARFSVIIKTFRDFFNLISSEKNYRWLFTT